MGPSVEQAPAAPAPAAPLASRPAAVAAALFVASLALVLPRLGTQSIWFDEAVTMSNAQQPFELGRYLRADATPPLYPFLVHHWMRLFGTTLESARALSALASALSTVLLFQLGRRFLGATAGLFAALLFLCSRFQLFFAHEARPYALVVLLCVASFYAVFALSESVTRTRLLLLALLDAALLYAHYVTVFVLPAQALAALLLVRAQPRTVVAVVASQALAVLLVLPLVAYVASTLWPLPMAGWLAPPTWQAFPIELAKLAGSPLLLALEAVLVIAGLAWLARERSAGAAPAGFAPRSAAALASWALVPLAAAFVASFVEPVFLARYLLYAAPGYFLLVGYVAASLPLARGRVALLLVLCTLSLVTAWRTPIVRPAWGEAARRAHAALGSGAVVAVVPAHQLLPFSFHFSRDAFREPQTMPATLRAAGVLGLSRMTDLPGLAARTPDLLVIIPDGSAAALAALAAELAATGHGPPVREQLPGIVLLRLPPGPAPPS